MALSNTSTHFLDISRDSVSTTSLGSLFQYLITLSEKKFFLISNLNLSWHNLSPFPLVLLLLSGKKKANTHPTTALIKGVGESSNVAPEPPLLQTKQSQFPQLLIVRLVLQTLHLET